ncbi:hypothetical protein [Bacillus paralicheniformis]|uniref:hypothetical protein n=1 Tax=Bacillus paralicheniformis TaxID=1648923 RepID=UPI001177A096|nr:hypothetical protein [Bacillus paralicheniformis]MCU4668647.1 DUF4062 domain-containing protein [Bacillus paralicheniformis]
MSFKADVLQVFIASPSDVSSQRDEIENAIFDWNRRFAEELNIVLLPNRWEKDVAPTYHPIEPQRIINETLVKKCDILIGVFWTKLGTRTTSAPSGTLEEIESFIHQQKEVLIYFVDNPVPRDGIDYDELKRVDEFKKKYTGLYSSYDKYKVIDHLYDKVVEYKRNNPESAFIQRELTKKKIEEVNLKNLIYSGSLTVNEFLLLGYILETGNRSFGVRWMADDSKNMILKWENQRSLGKSNLIDNYESVLENFLDRGLIEPKDYTEYGNVKLYKMPMPIFDELRNLAPVVKQEIYEVVNSHYFELPF